MLTLTSEDDIIIVVAHSVAAMTGWNFSQFLY